MNYETISADEFGRSLSGVGVNILVKDVRRTVSFLERVFVLKCHQVSNDFAIVSHDNHVFQLHADHTYHSHPMINLVPENPPRGLGIEIRLYDCDPDTAVKNAEAHQYHVLEPAITKPHGLREAFIQCHDGYVWCPSIKS